MPMSAILLSVKTGMEGWIRKCWRFSLDGRWGLGYQKNWRQARKRTEKMSGGTGIEGNGCRVLPFGWILPCWERGHAKLHLAAWMVD